MKLNEIVSEIVRLNESKISQVVSLWKSKRIPVGIDALVRLIGVVRDDATGKPLSGNQVISRLTNAGMSEDDPSAQKIQAAADRTFSSYMGKVEYEKEMNRQKREIGLKMKGAAKRKSRPFYQEA